LKIKFFSLIKFDLKKDEVDYQLSGSKSVKEIIKLLDQEFANYFNRKLLKDGELKSGTIILLNGRNICHLQGLDTLVENKDEITIFPPSGGGYGLRGKTKNVVHRRRGSKVKTSCCLFVELEVLEPIRRWSYKGLV